MVEIGGGESNMAANAFLEQSALMTSRSDVMTSIGVPRKYTVNGACMKLHMKFQRIKSLFNIFNGY